MNRPGFSAQTSNKTGRRRPQARRRRAPHAPRQLSDNGNQEQTGEALRESEARFRALATASSDVIYRMSPDWSEMRELQGRQFIADTREPSRTWLQKYIHPDDRRRVLSVIRSAVRARTVFELEHRVLRADGSIGWTFSRALPVLDARGRIIEWLGTAKDVTARKQAELALQQQEATLEEVGRIARIGGWELNVARGEVLWTDEVARIHDMAPGSKMTVKDGLRFYPADSRRRMEAAVGAAITDSKPYDVELEIVTRKGARKWIRVIGHPVIEGGRVMKLRGSLQDISDRKQAEAAMRESEVRLGLSARAANVGLWDWNLRSNAVHFSPVWKSQIGYRDDEIPNRFEEWRSRVHPDDLKPTLRNVRAFLRDPKGHHEAEFRFRHKDGTYRWIYTHADVLRDASGRPARMLGCHIDITERKAAEEALQADLAATRRLAELGMSFAGNGGLKPALTAVVDAAIAIMGADFGNLQLLDATSGHLRIAAHRGFPKWWLDFWSSVHPGRGVCGTARAIARRVIVDDVESSPIFADPLVLSSMRRIGVRAVQSTPLVSRGGTIVGMLSTHYKTSRPPDERMLALLDLLARQAADLIERAQTDAVLRESEERLRRISDNANVGLTRCSRHWVYLSANPAYAEIVGLPLDRIVGRPIVDVMGPAAAATIRPYVERVLRGKRVTYEAEVPISRAGRRFLHVSYTPDTDVNGRVVGWIACVTDITERKAAEDALRESEERFRAIFDTSADGLFVSEPHGRRFYLANKACLKMLGYTLTEFKTFGFQDLIFPEDVPYIRREIERFNQGKALRTSEFRFRRKDGSILFAEVNPTRMKLKSRDFVLVVLRDVTERRRMESEIQSVSEYERQRIGRDLHDGLGQTLTAVRYMTSAARTALARRNVPETEELDRIMQRLDVARRQSHDLARGLFPDDFRGGGFVPALRDLAASTSSLFSVSCRFTETGKGDNTDGEILRHLYRIAQEAVNNAVKHSHGKQIWIRLKHDRRGTTLSVRDDGVGIRTRVFRRTDMGLHIMRYRAHMIGAMFSTRSAPGRGTTVTCFLPRIGQSTMRRTR